jgi:hypothetical protein
MTNSKIARYFLEGDMPKVVEDETGCNAIFDGIDSFWNLVLFSREGYCLLPEYCTIHLHHPDKFDELIKISDLNDEIKEAVESYTIYKSKRNATDFFQWQNSHKFSMRIECVNSLFFEKNIYAGDINKVPQNVKLI